MRRICSILAALLAAALSLGAQNTIKVNVQNLVALDEQFNISFIIEGEGKVTSFEWEPGDDFQLVWGPQKGTSSSISIINGKRTQSSQTTYTYVLMPRSAGTFQLPAATATIKGEAYPGIGVAVADNPAGPYTDPIKKPLVKGWFKIDPTVFIDDNGQAYLYYGNNNLWYVKLNQNMTSFTGGENSVNVKNESAFGPHKNDNGDPNFEEASWLYKRNGKYYLEYAAGGVPEYWAYSTANKPTGPWTYQGKILGEAGNSFTIHGGSVEYKGHYYMFYHNGKLPNGGGYNRSTCIEEFTPNEDGTIPFINFTTKGVEPLQTLNPFVLQEAETINQCKDVLCEGDYNGCYVTHSSKSSYIKVRNVDFGEDGATTFKARVKSEGNAKIVIRIGSKSGTAKGTLTIEPTNGEWVELSCNLSKSITGVQDLFFTMNTPSAKLQFDNWQFFQETSGIRNVNAERPANQNVYDLQGRQTNGANNGHSIHIINGKKVIK